MHNSACKICGSPSLSLFAHTAECQVCGTLLCFPYPKTDTELIATGGRSYGEKSVKWWYSKASFRNHTNFTNMIHFALGESYRERSLEILDYGGGGGQFAVVCKSLFPMSTIHIVDIDDGMLLDEWRPLNRQIRFRDFANDETKFDVIFMNDVFEHVSDPAGVLKLLATKLKADSIVFIDTPKQFWIYPLAKLLSKSLYAKLLKGTVDHDHQQIWSRKSFELVARQAGLQIVKYRELSEFTMNPEFYLKNMGITNSIMVSAAKLFYRSATLTANNKIMAVLKPGAHVSA